VTDLVLAPAWGLVDQLTQALIDLTGVAVDLPIEPDGASRIYHRAQLALSIVARARPVIPVCRCGAAPIMRLTATQAALDCPNCGRSAYLTFENDRPGELSRAQVALYQAWSRLVQPPAVSTELQPCPCGGAVELDASGTSEFAGASWQDWSVTCAQCERAAHVGFNGDRPDEGRWARAAAIEAWNHLVQAAPV